MCHKGLPLLILSKIVARVIGFAQHLMYTMYTDEEVFYMDCTMVPLEHLELSLREVFLPLLGTNLPSISGAGVNGDKVVDILHRLMAAVQVTRGHVEVGHE